MCFCNHQDVSIRVTYFTCKDASEPFKRTVCPTVAEFQSVPLHHPCCLNDKDSPSREGKASEVDGGGRGGQKGLFRRDGLRYFGFVHGAEASPIGGSGHSDPIFRVTGKESNTPAEISFFSRNLSKMCSPCVYIIKCVKTDEKQSLGGRLLSRSWPRPPILLSHGNP